MIILTRKDNHNNSKIKKTLSCAGGLVYVSLLWFNYIIWVLKNQANYWKINIFYVSFMSPKSSIGLETLLKTTGRPRLQLVLCMTRTWHQNKLKIKKTFQRTMIIVMFGEDLKIAIRKGDDLISKLMVRKDFIWNTLSRYLYCEKNQLPILLDKNSKTIRGWCSCRSESVQRQSEIYMTILRSQLMIWKNMCMIKRYSLNNLILTVMMTIQWQERCL